MTPPLRRLLSTTSAAALRQTSAAWSPVPLYSLRRAASSLFHVTLDVSSSPHLSYSHTRPGQYLHVRVPGSAAWPVALAVASPPWERAEMEFLVKAVAGSTSEALCRLREGDVVEVGPVMGNGFEIERIGPPQKFPTVLIFATGAGISPIRSLIESGFGAGKRPDVRLYYGARNLRRMAYQDRFREWEASGIKIVPVLSQPDDSWTGECGYVQAAFARAKNIYNPQGTGVLLCGQKQMTEEVTSLLLADGVSSDKILKNF